MSHVVQRKHWRPRSCSVSAVTFEINHHGYLDGGNW